MIELTMGLISRKPKVLVVDDERLILLSLKAILEKHGYEVRTCANARETLSVLAEESGQFDLAILDYMLPDLRGDEIAKEIRRSYQGLPIIFISAFYVPPEVKSLADTTLTKPEAPEVLLEAVRKLIAKEDVAPERIWRLKIGNTFLFLTPGSRNREGEQEL